VEALVSSTALAAAVPLLRCPHCRESLRHGERSLVCSRGHSFDIARQGHVSLLPPRRPSAGDASDMVAARVRFLESGHYVPIAAALVDAAREAAGSRPGWVVDLGAGPGYYLAQVLRALPGRLGIALDASRPALRRAVRADTRIAAVACDLWRRLPLADAAADLAINVFAPRDASEIARVLARDGALVVVTPTARHLRELAQMPGTLSVEADKQARLRRRLSPRLTSIRTAEVEFGLRLDRDAVRALVAMGPSAHHARLDRLPADLDVTASVIVETFRR
jgi:23S rRNA (guanine745-N1)-methyltransferase